MHQLGGAEIKVFFYICRRTMGFDKRADAIGIRQMCSGIVTANGRRLDHGAGLSKTSALRAVGSLESLGLIRRKQRSRSRLKRASERLEALEERCKPHEFASYKFIYDDLGDPREWVRLAVKPVPEGYRLVHEEFVGQRMEMPGGRALVIASTRPRLTQNPVDNGRELAPSAVKISSESGETVLTGEQALTALINAARDHWQWGRLPKAPHLSSGSGLAVRGRAAPARPWT